MGFFMVTLRAESQPGLNSLCTACFPSSIMLLKNNQMILEYVSHILSQNTQEVFGYFGTTWY